MYPRFVIEAIVCLPKDDSARLLNFLHEWRVGGDNPWFLTAANLAGSCRLLTVLTKEHPPDSKKRMKTSTMAGWLATKIFAFLSNSPSTSIR